MFEDEQRTTEEALTFAVPLGWTAGDVGDCRSCHAPVMWCTTPNNRRAPINPDGVSHFATCPDSAAWRKRGAH